MLGLDLRDSVLSGLAAELEQGLRLYWQAAGRVLSDATLRLAAEPAGYYAAQANFFSALFLYSYWRGGVKPERRSLYVALNQCLRGMVTGCDNLLDDEYKPTLATDLPAGATRFRSIIDIMVSDRVLYELLAAAGFTAAELLLAGRVSLATLAPSGAEEAREEGGLLSELGPQEVLTQVHHYKTGLLFQAPWALPALLEQLDSGLLQAQKQALYDIGLGCQILDDMVDLERDQGHPNYLAALMRVHSPAEARALAGARAQAYLSSGFAALLAPEHRDLQRPAIAFIIERIGAGQIRDAG